MKNINQISVINGGRLGSNFCAASGISSLFLKLMEVNGSPASYDLVYQQMIQQFKMMKPGVAQSVWDSAKTDVFDKEIVYLKKDLISVYARNFTPEEIKQLIAFYTSPLGQNWLTAQPKSRKNRCR